MSPEAGEGEGPEAGFSRPCWEVMLDAVPADEALTKGAVPMRGEAPPPCCCICGIEVGWVEGNPPPPPKGVGPGGKSGDWLTPPTLLVGGGNYKKERERGMEVKKTRTQNFFSPLTIPRELVGVPKSVQRRNYIMSNSGLS